MIKMPSYSVLMSVYAKENPIWFKESIESMMGQTVPTDDFVIVKDGPLTRELEQVISEYISIYPSIFNIITLKENQGLGPALAVGIVACKHEYIARMDSDDISIPTRIEEQTKILQEKKYDIIGSYIAEFIDTKEHIVAYRNLPVEHDQIVRFSKRRNPFGHPSVILAKTKVLEAGNFRSYYLCEDYDMWLRMIEKGAVCYNIPTALVYMRISKDFYARRGGLKYLKSIIKFKREQYHKGYYSLLDYIISAGGHIVICLLPNKIRETFYKKVLRKRV